MLGPLDYRSALQGRCCLYLFAGFTFVFACVFLTREAYILWKAPPVLPGNTAGDLSWQERPLPQALPPLYFAYHDAEERLSQQDWTRTSPAEHDKFFFVAGHTRALGWGNAVQEHILNSYLAYKAGRSFVFGNFTWNDDGSWYSDYEQTGKIIPSQIPYSVLLRGPIVGEQFPAGDNAPLAVTWDYFDHVCPEKRELRRDEIHASLSSPNSVAEITEKWSSILRTLDDPCVQSDKESGPIYSHHDIWGVRSSLLDVWEDLKRSPMLTQFGWSPLVELAFDVNRELFMPTHTPQPYLSSTAFTSNAERYTPIPGLMVIHVRRGDYASHCRTLAMWSEDFVSVNAFPGMRDPFTVPAHDDYGWGRNSPANVEAYRQRCLPTVDEIAAKVAAVRAESAARGVRRLYIMTNGRPAYIAELKRALERVAEWDAIASSRDLVLNWEQRHVSHAVDLLVAQRAQVLVGNGFSTLTSNAVMMRLANGFPTDSIRFW
ncbi:hypothetical protein BD413DRAFT_629446 [Trametes elegans]|nr:hypothetical protein BD413DRAFT_629446 [Trametes elegans]